MAVRRPMWIDQTTGQPRSFTTAELSAIRQEAGRRCFSGTSLSRKGTNDANLNGINDSRLQAGAYTSNATTYQNPADTSTVNVTYDYVDQTVLTGILGQTWKDQFPLFTPANVLRPCYYEAGNLKVMTKQDVMDTFVYPAITAKHSSTTDNVNQFGYYFSSTTTSPTGGSNISTSVIYADTRANAGAYVAGSIPNTLDQPTTITNYYLSRTNGTAMAANWTGRLPAFIGSTGNLYHPHSSTTLGAVDFSELFWGWLEKYFQEANESAVGYRLRYQLAASSPATGAVTRGSGMTDTKLNSQTTLYRFVNADDYRSQDVPAGSAASIGTYYLWAYLS